MRNLAYLIEQEPSLHASMVATLLSVTRSSNHTYETAMQRLLIDLEGMYRTQVIDQATYEAIIGTGVDVLFFFNYDHQLLQQESNVWYRASIIHQIGQGMLQALEQWRPDLTSRAFYREAMSALALTRDIPHPIEQGAHRASPLHWKQWVKA